MYDVIWAVDSGRKVIGYIVVDKNGQVQYEFWAALSKKNSAHYLKVISWQFLTHMAGVL